jgi:8-oxo-dGTP pyrophosphatase MutT (NUDIX family)
MPAAPWPPSGWRLDDLAPFTARLNRKAPSLHDVIARPRGDHDLQPHPVAVVNPELLKPAAVLVPIIDRPEGATLLLTRRADSMRQHSGQIAFPGGRIDRDDGEGDHAPITAAMREAEEEIGLDRRHVAPLGFLDAYLTGTGYRVMPVVARIAPGFALARNPDEVAEIFEVPLPLLMDPAKHRRDGREWKGVWRTFYAIDAEGRYIWGATAGIIRHLYECLSGDQA